MKIKWKRACLLSLVFMLLCGMVAGLCSLRSMASWAIDHLIPPGPPIPVPPRAGDRLNILCIGVDKGSVPGETGWTRSDVLMLVSVDFRRGRVALVSIPRDTRVELEGRGTQKINAAHAFGGPPDACEAVSALTGMDIHGYIEVDFNAFRAAVDAMGGVPVHMDYEIRDPRVGCLGAGDIWLTGRDALVLCRSRDLPGGDVDRIANQQKFLTAMAGRLVDMDLPALKRILDAVQPYWMTSLRGSELLDFVEALRGTGVENIQMATLPGSEPEPAPGELWYYVHDPAATRRLMEDVKEYCTVEAPPEDEIEQVALDDLSQLPLAVLNGTGRDGLALQAAQELQEKGYQPVPGNTLNPYERTTIYVSPGYSDLARRVVGDFWEGHDPPIRVDEEVTAAHQARVVVVLGSDCP